MGKRCRGRLVHGRGGRGGSSDGTKPKLTRRAGKRGRATLTGMPDGGLSMIDCLIATLPGDRPNNRRGRGNGGSGGGGGRDGRPRSGARGGRPLSRDTAKPEGSGAARRGLVNGNRHTAALADYAANIMAASSSDSESDGDGDGDGAFSILADIAEEKAKKTRTAASKRRRVLAAAGAFAAGLNDLEGIEFGRVIMNGETGSDPDTDANAETAVEEARKVTGATFATRFVASGQTPDHDPANDVTDTNDPDTDVTGDRCTPGNAAACPSGQSAGASVTLSRTLGSLSFERVYGAVAKFVSSVDAKLLFPALDRLDRWKVHQVANLFHLTSSSVGKGKKRKKIMLVRPVEPYGPSSDEVEQARRAFRDAAVTAEFPELPPASRSTVSVDGLVGGDAESIGPANRGFGMLAKMGWKPGESLGLTRNGRTDPVLAVKRPRRRSGLGE